MTFENTKEEGRNYSLTRLKHVGRKESATNPFNLNMLGDVGSKPVGTFLSSKLEILYRFRCFSFKVIVY